MSTQTKKETTMWKSPSATGGKRKRPRPSEIIDLLDSDSDESSSSSVVIVLPTAVKVENGINRNSAGNNGECNNNDDDATERIVNEFLGRSANAPSVGEALALHRGIMDLDSDSSSTGSDLGKIWGLTPINANDIDTDSTSDSSIEVLSNPPSPRPIGMNGRYLSGRQRRLEIARSKNTASAAAISGSEQSSQSSDDECLKRPARKGDRSPASTNNEVTTPATRKTTPSKSTVASKPQQSDIETSPSSSEANETTNDPSEERKPSATAPIPSKSPPARKSTSNKNVKSNERTAFDNLFSNGKDFLHWTGITDPYYFLEHHREFVSKVNVWRKENNLPLFHDSKEYIRKLRVQIKDNLQRMGSKQNQSCPCPEASETQEKGPEKAKKEQKNRVSVVGAAADGGRRLCEICGDQGYL